MTEHKKEQEPASQISLEALVIQPTGGSAELCREKGWQVGDKLVGDEGYGPTVIQITAIGERNVLAKRISHDGEPEDGYENIWTLFCRDWEKVV